MRLWGRFLLFALGACAQTTPLEGGWRSNRALTLAEIRQARTFTPAQLEKLADPDFFGHLIQIYRGDEVITVLEGECSEPRKFEILDSDGSSVTIRYFDERSGAERDLRLDVDADKLYVPFSIAETDLREVFTRVPLRSAVLLSPCAREFTGE
jgi:hypothetical protein